MDSVCAQKSNYDCAYNADSVAGVFERDRHGQYTGAETGLYQVHHGFDKPCRTIKNGQCKDILILC